MNLNQTTKQKYDKYEYIRNNYNVDAKKNKIVRHKKNGRFGTITGTSGPHLKVALNGESKSGIYHPYDFDYINN